MRLVGKWLVMAAGLWLAAFGVSAQPTLRVFTTPFVLPAKFEALKPWAEAEGLRLDPVYAERGKAGTGLVEGADLIVLDGPRPNDMAAVKAAVGDSLTGRRFIAVGGGPPSWGGLDAADAMKLVGYYAAGGEANYRIFLKAARRVIDGQSLNDLPPAPRRAASALYHPDAGVLPDAEAFRAWRGRDRPVVLFAISDGAVINMQTQVVDAAIRDAETRGLNAAAFWYDERDPQALTRVAGPLQAVALVNMTHMQNANARPAEFAALGIPVIQTMGTREATADWRTSDSGVPAASVPVQFATSESWGMSDPLVISAVENGAQVPIAEQIALLGSKLRRLADLRIKPNGEKRLALMFWNTPAGENNFAASNLNVPKSLEAITAALNREGYAVPPARETDLIRTAQRMMGGYYRPETLDALERDGLAACLPVAVYRKWLDGLPLSVKAELLTQRGTPETHKAVRGNCLRIPAARIGRLILMPQPPRASRVDEATHDTKSVPDHGYLAAYLWLRESEQIDALIHFGTHGTQEWTPGKERGLWAYDYPNLAVGDVPVIYPYIQDNVAEAIQAKRRGRAVIISHQTPPFAPSGLYEDLRDLHALIHEYEQLTAGGVRERVEAAIVAKAVSAHLHDELGFSEAQARSDFTGFYAALHEYLHELAGTAVPLGLHTFGQPAAPEYRLMTVMQALGKPYIEALELDPQEAFAGDFAAIRQGEAYRLLYRHIVEGAPLDPLSPALREQVAKARAHYERLSDTGEMQALIAALAGRFVLPSTGGDPVRDPQLLSGRNLYAFDAAKIPTKAAYADSEAAYKGLLEAYKAKHGRLPRKLAFSLWSGESIRTLGVMEGQVLRAYGLEPVWDDSGRVVSLRILPEAELSAPRVDAVLQLTSVYRDQFDHFMGLLARAIDALAQTEGHPLAENSAALQAQLEAKGLPPERAAQLARLRMFSNAPGEYGSGLPGRVVDAASWDTEGELAEGFLERLQYGYGSGGWGEADADTNLLAENLKGVDAAVLSRSSNLHGLLSTDHPFEYLGGLSLAVRHLTGKSPDLFVTDSRSGQVRVTTPGAFLSAEMRTRYLNPQWIKQMQAEGYAGANEMLSVTNNLFGWQVTDPASVRPDQWQAMTDVYVRDKYELGLNEWFAEHHPSAQTQMIEQMLQAVAKGYWQPDAETLKLLQARQAGAETTATAGGYGLGVQPPAEAQIEAAQAEAASAPDRVRGQMLRVQPETPPAPVTPLPYMWLVGLGAGLLMLAGALNQWRASRFVSLS